MKGFGKCYWGIYRKGSNGADIVDNDIVSGDRCPSMTHSAGQRLENLSLWFLAETVTAATLYRLQLAI